MARHPELPPAAARRKRARRPRITDNYRADPLDDQEAHILAIAYAAHRNTRGENDE